MANVNTSVNTIFADFKCLNRQTASLQHFPLSFELYTKLILTTSTFCITLCWTFTVAEKGTLPLSATSPSSLLPAHHLPVPPGLRVPCELRALGVKSDIGLDCSPTLRPRSSPNFFPCQTSKNSPVSEHPERMRVPSEHREPTEGSDPVGRDLTCALNPLAATLAEKYLLSPAVATDPRMPFSKPCICHTSETPRRVSSSTLTSRLPAPLSRLVCYPQSSELSAPPPTTHSITQGAPCSRCD